MKTKICSSCGFVGKPVHDEYSSLIIDLLAWMGAFVVAAITGIIYLAVIGPLITVWHVLTFRSHRCPKCGNWEMHRLPDDDHHAVTR